MNDDMEEDMSLKESFGKFIGKYDYEYDDDSEYEKEDEELEEKEIGDELPNNIKDYSDRYYNKDHYADVQTVNSSNSDKVVNIHNSLDMQLIVCKPSSGDDCTSLIDDLKTRKPIVLNIESLELEEQRRIFEFVKGAVYALGGSIQKVSKGIFIIAPSNVKICGKDSEKAKYEKDRQFK